MDELALFAIIILPLLGFLLGSYIGKLEKNRISRSDDFAQQPVANRVEPRVREAGDFPRPPESFDNISNLKVSYSEDGQTLLVSCLYDSVFVCFFERHGRWRFGYGKTPQEATHRPVLSGNMRDVIDEKSAISLTKRLAQTYLKDVL